MRDRTFSGAVTLGGFRLGALAARACPDSPRLRWRRRSASARARRIAMDGRWSSATSAAPIRRSEDWRYVAPCRRRSTPTRGTGSRASVCRACTSRSSTGASRCPGTSTSPQGSTAGSGVILALPHLGGWEWAGRWLARPRRQDHGRRRAARSARVVRLVRQAAQRARHDGGGARSRRRQGRARSAQAQRGGVPVERP